MGSQRRIGSPRAKIRTGILDAAEQLMLEAGYAAVTSRNVARKAATTYQSVFYYFRSMDDLFLALLERRAEEGLARQAAALASDHPLRALWEFNTETEAAVLTTEFAALANHRKAVRAALARVSSRFRTAERVGLEMILRDYGIRCPGAVVAVLMAATARTIVLEEELGVTGGHRETLDFVENQLRRLEHDHAAPPHPAPPAPRPAAPFDEDLDVHAVHDLLANGGLP